MKKISKAVIPAAGFGTRFLPFTKSVPKEMLPIIDTPAIEYNIREAINSGITDIVIVISPDKECIKTHFLHNEIFEQFLIKKGKTHELDIITEMPNTINVKFVYQKEDIVSKSKNTPFIGHEFYGRIKYTILNGNILYSEV